MPDLTDVITTMQAATAAMNALIGEYAGTRDELADWGAGTIDGGPNEDGYYPITRANGDVFLVPCPRLLEEIAGTGGGGTPTPTPAPVANNRSGVIVPNATATAIDLSGFITGSFSSIAAGNGAHGTTTESGAIVTYTPTGAYSGADSFTYTATGTGGTSPPATVSLVVEAATPVPEPLITLIKTGTQLYVRQPMHNEPTKDSVRLVIVGLTQSSTVSGSCDFTACRTIPKSTLSIDTLAAYAAGDTMWTSLDNGAPVKYNNLYVGGGHSVTCFKITSSGHGLTKADVGRVGVIGSKSWVLVDIIDANTLMIVAANTGVSVTNWIINGAPTATGTITFPVVGAKAYTASLGAQAYPMLQNLIRRVYADDELVYSEAPGESILGDGLYGCSTARVRETYGIPNPAQWLLDLQAAQGTMTPKWLNDPSNQTQVTIDQTWYYDIYGAQTGSTQAVAVQSFTMAGSGSYDYFGGHQHQALAKTGHKLLQYLPNLSAPVSGYDFTALADITANTLSVQVTTANYANPLYPPGRSAQILMETATSIKKYGFAMSYLAYRMTLAQNAKQWQLSNSEKQYPVGFDYNRWPNSGGYKTVPAGTTLPPILFFDQSYIMDTRQTLTVDALYQDPIDDKPYRVLDIHATLSNAQISMPASLVDFPVAVVPNSASASFTLHSATVQAGGPTGGYVEVSVSGGYGFAVLKVS